jgi:hypothetical protein
MSKSARPYKRTPPSWLKVSAVDVEDHICKFAKKGLTPSQIGVILRDSHGVAQVKSVTGSKVLRILKKNGTNLGTVLQICSASWLICVCSFLCAAVPVDLGLISVTPPRARARYYLTPRDLMRSARMSLPLCGVSRSVAIVRVTVGIRGCCCCRIHVLTTRSCAGAPGGSVHAHQEGCGCPQAP